MKSDWSNKKIRKKKKALLIKFYMLLDALIEIIRKLIKNDLIILLLN